MYRRPRSLEVLLDIRTSMSEECGYDVVTFVELMRSGRLSGKVTRTVTREEGDLCEEIRPDAVADPERVDITHE